MPVTRRPAPTLVDCPRVRTIAKHVRRSYPTGRQAFSRGFVGAPMELTVSADEPVPAGVRASLVTTLKEEKQFNTFFRLASPGVIARLHERFPELPEQPDAKTVFVKLRELRNKW